MRKAIHEGQDFRPLEIETGGAYNTSMVLI